MALFAFIGALSLSLIAFELASALTGGLVRTHRLDGPMAGEAEPAPRRSTWQALLLILWPGRFAPAAAKDAAQVVGLLRRAGYPYNTPGEFYAASIRIFSIYLALGGLLAGGMFFAGLPLAELGLAGVFIFQGLRQPYSSLRRIARRRAEAMRNNMLSGLAMLNALISSGVGVQEALRRTAGVGGPFCNLLGLLIARMEVEEFGKAIETTRAHLPDAADVEMGLFLRDMEDFFVRNRPLLPGVQALQEAVHRNLVEATEARAGLVRQRSGLFGILAVLGLVLSIISPFAGVFF